MIPFPLSPLTRSQPYGPLSHVLHFLRFSEQLRFRRTSLWFQEVVSVSLSLRPPSFDELFFLSFLVNKHNTQAHFEKIAPASTRCTRFLQVHSGVQLVKVNWKNVNSTERRRVSSLDSYFSSFILFVSPSTNLSRDLPVLALSLIQLYPESLTPTHPFAHFGSLSRCPAGSIWIGRVKSRRQTQNSSVLEDTDVVDGTTIRDVQRWNQSGHSPLLLFVVEFEEALNSKTMDGRMNEVRLRSVGSTFPTKRLCISLDLMLRIVNDDDALIYLLKEQQCPSLCVVGQNSFANQIQLSQCQFSRKVTDWILSSTPVGRINLILDALHSDQLQPKQSPIPVCYRDYWIRELLTTSPEAVLYVDKEGNTMLHHMCLGRCLPGVKMLIASHPELAHSRNIYGETPIFSTYVGRQSRTLRDESQSYQMGCRRVHTVSNRRYRTTLHQETDRERRVAVDSRYVTPAWSGIMGALIDSGVDVFEERNDGLNAFQLRLVNFAVFLEHDALAHRWGTGSQSVSRELHYFLTCTQPNSEFGTLLEPEALESLISFFSRRFLESICGSNAVSGAFGQFVDLVEKGLSLDSQDWVCHPLKFVASSSHHQFWNWRVGQIKKLEKLSVSTLGVDRVIDEDGSTALMLFAKNGHVSGLRLACERCPEAVRIPDSRGRTTILLAVPHRRCVDYLISLWPEGVTLADTRGAFPLLVAVKLGDAYVVEELLRAGANPNREVEGNSSYMIEFSLSSSKRLDVASLLIRFGGKLTLTCRNRFQRHLSTTLFPFADASMQCILEGFVEQEIALSSEFLFHSIRSGNKSIGILRCSPHLDLSATDSLGRTPLLAAADYGLVDLVNEIVQKIPESSIAHLDARGRSVLHCLCGAFSITSSDRSLNSSVVVSGIVQIVQKCPAIVNCRDDSGSTPFCVLVKCNPPNAEIIGRVLVDAGAIVVPGEVIFNDDGGEVTLVEYAVRNSPSLVQFCSEGE